MLIHIVAVPLFVVGVVAIGWSLVQGAWLAAGVWVAAPVVSLVLQKRGHMLEPVPSEPFTGPGNFVVRIFSEQFFRFWKYVFLGDWLRVVRGNSTKHAEST